MASISQELQQWAFKALDLGFGCISDGDHSPFVMVIDTKGQEHLVNLESANGVIDSNLVARGRQIIQSFKSAQFYALVWDGYLTTGRHKQDAVFVEAGTYREANAFVFAQKYKQKKRSKAVEKDGRPLAVTRAQHL